jgi:hypothetical protein
MGMYFKTNKALIVIIIGNISIVKWEKTNHPQIFLITNLETMDL